MDIEGFAESWAGAMVVGDEDEKAAQRLGTRFFELPVLDPVETEKEGCPKFKPAEFVEIFIPGDRLNVPIKPVDDEIKRIYRSQYKRWLENKSGEQINGMPLKELPGMTASEIAEMNYHKIFSVEDLANASEESMTRITGLRAKSVRAQDYLAQAKGAKAGAAMQAELAKRDMEIANMKAQLAAFMESQSRAPAAEPILTKRKQG